jgi:hypothetical protein
MRVVLAALLGAGFVSLVALPAPGSFLIVALAMLLGFLLSGAKAAVDLVDLVPAELIADAVTLVTLGSALALIRTANAVLIAALLAVAVAAQGLPRAVTMARCLRRSTSPPTPPGSA